MRGLDPRIHQSSKNFFEMDRRVELGMTSEIATTSET